MLDMSHASPVPPADGGQASTTMSEDTKDQIIAAQQRVIAGLRQQVADLEAFRKNVLAERTYLRRGDIDPTTKLTQVIAAWELGITFDNDNSERPKKYKTTTMGTIASQVGVSKNVVHTRLTAMTAPAKEGFTPIFEKQTVRKRNKETGAFYTVTELAPPEGRSWTATWGAGPLGMPKPPVPERAATDKERKRVKTAEERAVVAEARRILACCPACGSHDVSLRCHACGLVTTVDQALPVPTDTAPEGDSADSAFQDYVSSGKGGDNASPEGDSAENDLLGNEVPSMRCSVSPRGTLSAESPSEGSDSADSAFQDYVSSAVALLVDDDPERTTLLAAAVRTLLGAVGTYPNHVVMQRRRDENSNKYLSVSEPLSATLIAQHLLGVTTLGAGLLTSGVDGEGERTCRAVAYDSDSAFGALVAAARKLSAHGLSPLLVRNEAKKASGHLWLFFDRDVQPERVFATLETWAPMLAKVKERFPAPNVRGGHRLRLPGGCYLPVGLDPVPVQVTLLGETGDPEWEDALSPVAWAYISSAVTPAEAVQHAWIPPEQRPRPKQAAPAARAAPKRPATPGAATTIDEAVARFNAERPVSMLVDVNRSGMFRSPWHPDTSPSCKLYDDGHWCDFSRDLKGGDALNLWCALNGLWDINAEKPDRLTALRREGYLPEAKQGFSFASRDDVLLVSLHSTDQEKWRRAKAAFKAAFPKARYAAEEKAWSLPLGDRPAVAAWAKAFAQAQKAGQ